MKRPPAIALLAFGGVLALRVLVVDRQAALRLESETEHDVLESPGPEILRIATLEHPFGWADAVWLNIVQELARPLDGGKASWDRVFRWSNIATDLDPRYLTVYHAASIHLSVYGRKIDMSDALALKGWKALPAAWQLPLLIGYNAAFVRRDYAVASGYFLAASKLNGSPRYLPALAGRMQAFAGDEQGAIQMLEVLVEELPRGPQRDDAIFRLKALQSADRLRLYDAACERYRSEHAGALPETGEQLYRLGLAAAPPVEAFDEPIELRLGDDDRCEAYSEMIQVREEAARRRKTRDEEAAAMSTATSTATR